MNKIITLKFNKEFKRAYFKGVYKAHPPMTTYMLRNYTKPPINRIGITTAKKIGNAVARNRARRIIKAAYYMFTKEYSQNQEKVPVGYDFVFVAREGIKSQKSTQIYSIMKVQINALNQKINNKNNKR